MTASSQAFAPPFRFSAEALVTAVSGRAPAPLPPGTWSITTDSRLSGPGRVFVALRGEKLDGHVFVRDALASPGSGAIVEAGHPAVAGLDPGPGRLVVEVRDTSLALLALGRAARDTFQGPVVALTGSVGKTTTKDMIAAILSQRGAGLATEGNLNNLVGVPLTLLRLSGDHRWAVLEMGMNAFGEIDALARCARPGVRLITRIGRAHLERLGGIEGVARAKGELFATAGPGDVLVVNADDPMSPTLPVPEGVRVVRFGEAAGAEVRVLAARREGIDAWRAVFALGDESVDVRVPLAGRHNLSNALAAAAVAYALGLSGPEVRVGLDAVRAPAMRMQVVELPGGAVLINDAYNANETSVAAALRTLADEPAPLRVAVLGDMLELGAASLASHREVGRLAAGSGLTLLVGVGPHSAETVAAARAAGLPDARAHHARTHAEAAALVRPFLVPGARILLKGSRGMAMEKVAEILLDAPAGPEPRGGEEA